MKDVGSILAIILVVICIAILIMSILPQGGGALFIALLVAFLIWSVGQS